jgi:hypothetical protein
MRIVMSNLPGILSLPAPGRFNHAAEPYRLMKRFTAYAIEISDVNHAACRGPTLGGGVEIRDPPTGTFGRFARPPFRYAPHVLPGRS